ncbi:hypothetical protein D3C76_866630 [compost metagenome]
MDNKIVDFTSRLQKIKQTAENPVPLEDYNLSAQALIMDPALQIGVMVEFAASKYMNGNLEANKIHRLLECIRYIYDGFMPKFEFKTSVAVRQLPNEDSLTSYSVYCYGMSMDRMRTNAGDVVDEFRPSYRMEAQLMEFEEDFVIDKGTIYPDDWMEFDISVDDIMTKRTPRHFIRQMNHLVKINGGMGTLTSDGYVIVLPYGGRLGVMIALVLENPITLIPEDQRKKPE